MTTSATTADQMATWIVDQVLQLGSMDTKIDFLDRVRACLQTQVDRWRELRLHMAILHWDRINSEAALD